MIYWAAGRGFLNLSPVVNMDLGCKLVVRTCGCFHKNKSSTRQRCWYGAIDLMKFLMVLKLYFATVGPLKWIVARLKNWPRQPWWAKLVSKDHT